MSACVPCTLPHFASLCQLPPPWLAPAGSAKPESENTHPQDESYGPAL